MEVVQVHRVEADVFADEILELAGFEKGFGVGQESFRASSMSGCSKAVE